MAATPLAPAESAAAPEPRAWHAGLPGFPRDSEGPVFNAPWEARAFAMTLALHQRGEFTWKDWAGTLAEVIAEVARRGEADSGEHYYRHWLTALERIAARKGFVTDTLLVERRRQWEDAARRTPHGAPIGLVT